MTPSPNPHSPLAWISKRHLTLGLGLALLALALLWTLLWPLGRQLAAAGVGGLELAFWRLLLAGTAFFAHAGFTNRLALERRGDWGLFLPLGLLGVSGTLAALVMVDVPVRDLHFWLYLAPALLAAAFWLVAGNPARKLNLTLLLALAVTGLNLVSPGRLPDLGWGLALGIGLLGFLHFGRLALGRYAPVTLYALGLPLGALGLWPLVSFAEKGPLVWLGLAAFALLSSYLLYALFGAVLRLLGVPKALAVACAEPLAALLVLTPLLGTGLHPLGLVMAALAPLLVLHWPTPQPRISPAVKREHLKSRARGLPSRLHHPA